MDSSKGKFLAKYKTTLLSSGIPSFDSLLNGGLSVGCITLIEEDFDNTHCSLICKHIISCGLTYSQETALITDESKPELYTENLPKISTNKPPSTQSNADLSNLEIAWRYKGLKSVSDDFQTVKDSESNQTGENDLSKLSSHLIDCDRLEDNLSSALSFLEHFIKQKGGMRKPLRLVITSLGSPFWGVARDDSDLIGQYSKFMYRLKRLIDGVFITVVMTINADLIDSMANVETRPVSSILRGYSDYVFKLDSLPTRTTTTTTADAYNEISGLVRPLRLPSINSLEPIVRPNTLLWSYRVRRKRILFQEYSLPPCLADNTSRTNQIGAPNAGAGGNPSASLHTKIGCGVDF